MNFTNITVLAVMAGLESIVPSAGRLGRAANIVTELVALPKATALVVSRHQPVLMV